MHHPEPTALLTHLRRIEGQVLDIQQMFEEDRGGLDIITQIQESRVGLAKVEADIVRRHVQNCLEVAIASENCNVRYQKVADIMATLARSDQL